MAVQGHRRGGALVATAVAGMAFGVLVTGCTDGAEQAAGDGRHDGPGGGGGPAARADEVADPGRALEAVRQASAVLARSGGAKVRTSMETVSGGTRVTIQGSGVYDFARPVGQLTVRVPKDAMGAAEHRPITEVFRPGALYMKNRGAGVPADKWVRLDTGRLADGDLLTSGATDPLAAAELLGGARGVTYMRDEGVDGVPVRHYWGTIDLAESARTAPARDRAALAAAAKGLSGGTVAFDAFLDGRGRPRLLRYRFSVRRAASSPSHAGRAPMTVVSTVELSAFGVRPAIGLPAAADIYAGTVAAPQK